MSLKTELSQPYVYIFATQNPRFWKIGFTHDLPKRLLTTSTFCPLEVRLYGAVPTPDPSTLETALHKALAAHRVRGEWFADTEEVREVAEIMQRQDLIALAQWLGLSLPRRRKAA